MKRFLLPILMLLFQVGLFSQGWRPGEMEVLVPLRNPSEAELLYQLRFNGDIYPDHARLYLIQEELQRLKQAGFAFEILIEDLNEYYKDFWQNRTSYHTYEQIIALADSLVQNFPNICKKIIYGSSVGGRQLACLVITSNVQVNQVKPQVMFDGGIHGDEIGASENVIRFARDLCLNYGNDPYITNLINTREIWLYLMVNPDGRVNMSRYNLNGVDLNRDWGYMWNGEGYSTGAYSQIESKALRTCVLENNFVVHTSYHSGTVYISCPWSYRASPPPDNNHILQLAGVYASTSGYPNLPYGQGYTGMYPINGSTKDSNYGIMGSVSWTMEISEQKQPPASQIMLYYNYNRPAKLAMIEYAGYGIRGIVTNATTGQPVAAAIFVNNFLPCYTDPVNGDFHKYLTPGTYTVKVIANGYAPATVNNVVVTANNATQVNVSLQPAEGQYIYRVISCQIPNNNPADPGMTWNVIGPPDNQVYSIGKNGWIVVDMQTLVMDGPGPDIMVFEGDATPEGYTFFAGASMDGPWHSMGTGTGTTQFDFANCAISSARYFRLVDSGSGSANVLGAGFDLDAIKVLSSVSGPYLVLEGFTINDSSGNNNGQLDPGETAIMTITLKNVGNDAALSVSGTLTTGDQYVSVLTSSPQLFGNIQVNSTASAQYTISASQNVPAGHVATLLLNLTGSNISAQSKTITLTFPNYCLPSANCSYGDGFTGFALGTINNMNSGCSNHNGVNGYGNFTTMSTELQAGNSYTVSWKTGYSNQKASLWIDLNDDKTFSNNERLITDFTMAQANVVYTTNFTVPATVTPGTKRLRIRANWQNSSADPCTNFTYGETEDYSVVFPGSQLNAAFIANPTSICQGGQVQFTDQSTGNPTSWQWTFPGGIPPSSTLQNPVVVYPNPGVFSVTLTVSNASGSHSVTMPNMITVTGIPATPETPSGPSSLCQGNQVTSYTTNLSVYATGWVWLLEPLNAGTLVPSGNSTTIYWNPAFHGSAQLSVSATNQCGQSPFSGILSIVIAPTPLAAGQILGDTQVCQNETTVYYLQEPVTYAEQYEWKLIPENAGTLANQGMYCTISWSGLFTGTALLTVRGQNSCGYGQWSPVMEILVEDCTGTNRTLMQDWIEIYPNPATGFFYIINKRFPASEIKVQIFDSRGMEVYHQIFEGTYNRVDLSGFDEGIYLINCTLDHSVFTKKIILAR